MASASARLARSNLSPYDPIDVPSSVSVGTSAEAYENAGESDRSRSVDGRACAAILPTRSMNDIVLTAAFTRRHPLPPPPPPPPPPSPPLAAAATFEGGCCCCRWSRGRSGDDGSGARAFDAFVAAPLGDRCCCRRAAGAFAAAPAPAPAPPPRAPSNSARASCRVCTTVGRSVAASAGGGDAGADACASSSRGVGGRSRSLGAGGPRGIPKDASSPCDAITPAARARREGRRCSRAVRCDTRGRGGGTGGVAPR